MLQLAQKIFQETESVDLVLAAERRELSIRLAYGTETDSLGFAVGSFARNVILLAQAYGQVREADIGAFVRMATDC